MGRSFGQAPPRADCSVAETTGPMSISTPDAQRLRSVKNAGMPLWARSGCWRSTILRGDSEVASDGGDRTLGTIRPSRSSGPARAFAGARDGLTAEIALAVHPDRYVLIESDRAQGLTFAIATGDPIAADLIVLALRQGRAALPRRRTVGRSAGAGRHRAQSRRPHLRPNRHRCGHLPYSILRSTRAGCRAIAGCRRIDWRRTRRIAYTCSKKTL